MTLTQHLQAAVIVNEEGTMKDLARVKGWKEWAISSGLVNTEMDDFPPHIGATVLWYAWISENRIRLIQDF